MTADEVSDTPHRRVNASRAQGIQIGDGNTQCNHFLIQASAILPRPVQLPRAVPDFQGRTTEMEAINRHLIDHDRATTSRLIVVTGPGGMGKTALAINAATATRGIFVDGILFAELRGTQSRPLDPEVVLQSVLVSLGIPVDVATNSSTDKASLYRSMMVGTRRLVLLDNAHSPEQVETLLPPEPTCAVIVTSRKRLSLLRADLRINLGPIESEAAKRILAPYVRSTPTNLGPQDKQLAELATLCGNWPLALHIAGARVAHRSARAVHELISGLRDSRTRLRALRVGRSEFQLILEDSVKHLSDNAAKLFGRLSLTLDDSIPAWTAAILLEARGDHSRLALDELLEANLLDSPSGTDEERYFIHDLVRDMSNEMLPEDARDVLRVRTALLQEYKDRVVLCRKVLEPDRPPHGLDRDLSQKELTLLDEIEQPERWFELEKSALIQAVEDAYELNLDEIAVSIANSLPTYFIIRGTWNEWRAAYATAVRAAERCGDLVGQGYLLQGLANVERTMGQGTGAATLERSFACFLSTDDKIGQAYVLNDIGLVRMYEGQWAEAERALWESEQELVTMGHTLMALQPRRNYAISLMERGETAQAALELERVAESMDRKGDARWRAYTLADLGKAYRIIGDLNTAAERLNTAIDEMLRIGDFRWAAVTRIRLGDVYRSAAHPIEAETQYLLAGNQFEELGDVLWSARVLVSRASLSVDIGRPAEGVDLCVSGRQIFSALTFREDECWSLVVQSRVEAALGLKEESAASIEAARRVAAVIGRGDELVHQFLDDAGPDVR